MTENEDILSNKYAQLGVDHAPGPMRCHALGTGGVVPTLRVSATAALLIGSDETAERLLNTWHFMRDDWAKIYAKQEAQRMVRGVLESMGADQT